MNVTRNNQRVFAKFIFGLIVATLMFEVLLRVIEITSLWKVLPAAEVTLYGPDADTGYTIRPNVEGVWLTENRARIYTSAQGLRDRDTPFAKPANVFRIALTGDSITEALQVEAGQTFADLLEVRLSNNGKPVEVINLGMSGAIPTVQVARMNSLGTRFSPDLLVYMVNIIDFSSTLLREDTAFPGYRRNADGEWHLSYAFRAGRGYRLRQSWAGKIYYWLLDHSRVMRVVNARRNRGFKFDETSGSGNAPQAPPCGGRMMEAVATALTQPDAAPELRGVLDAFLRDVTATVRRANAPAVLVVRGLAPRCPADAESAMRMKAELEAHLRSLDIGMIDMDAAVVAAMREIGMGNSINVLYGFGAHIGFGHLNRSGHEIFSHALATGLVPWVKPAE